MPTAGHRPTDRPTGSASVSAIIRDSQAWVVNTPQPQRQPQHLQTLDPTLSRTQNPVMFSSQLGRAVRASTTLSHTPATHHRTATACLATSATSLQPKQRRLSSSKASSSPDGNNSKSSSSSSRNNSGGAKPLANAAEPEGAATATATSTATTTTTTSTPLGRRASGRRTRDATYKPKKSNGAAAVAAAAPRADGVFERLPKVAETGHLHPQGRAPS